MLSLTKQRFLKAGSEYTHVALYHKLTVDFDTPISLFHKLEADFLLESVESETTIGRYSIIACGKQVEFVLRGREIGVTEFSPDKSPQRAVHTLPNPLDLVQSYLSEFKLPDLPDDFVPFYGGLIGYLGYETVRYFEDVPTEAAGKFPDGILVMPDVVLIHDNFKRCAYLIRVTPTASGAAGYEHTAALFQDLLTRLQAPTEVVPLPDLKGAPAPVKANFKKDRFLRAIAKCIDYIRNGEAVQVVLSQRFEVKTQAEPLHIYRRLRHLNPSPYMYYLRFDDFHLIGSSPEVMIRVENGEIILRPLAGARPRGASAQADARLEADMLSDKKELSEHLMLVDLGRNDLGRVAETGSVKVVDYMSVQKFSHVMHIVSTIKAKLRPDKTVFDAIAATFPAGTLSGAPKCRAMEIIAELEQARRDYYGGMALCMGFNQYLNSCIAIRTMLLQDQVAYIQSGFGVVADSKPEREYDESLNKAAALFAAINAKLEK